MNKILAGIVLYNPNLERLEKNIQSIYSQVPSLVLVNNGSDNYNSIKEKYKGYSKIIFIDLVENKGIACAQNAICEYAQKENYEWAITLDQDSICPDNLVSGYEEFLNMPNVGMLCPRIIDINCGDIDVYDETKKFIQVRDCLASASVIKIEAWKQVGGFYEPLFIDKVDFDICYSLRKNGYVILRINNIELYHEVGHSTSKRVFGMQIRALNHSHIRYYYMTRNSIIMIKRHGFEMRWLKGILLNLYAVMMLENDKTRKCKSIFLGLFHGLVGKEGEKKL